MAYTLNDIYFIKNICEIVELLTVEELSYRKYNN